MVIAAGGSGKRMKRRVPKQYLEIAGKTVIEHTMGAFLGHEVVSGVVVVTAPDDTRWKNVIPSHPKFLCQIEGGTERCDSVLSGLEALKAYAGLDDWVLVHDAARPCISKALIDKLVKKVMRHPVGGILGLPVTDTMKKTDNRDGIIQSVPRENIWRAQTPQMFRLNVLCGALSDLKQRNSIVTDEASAMEFMGMRPLMVKGSEANLKITTPSDLPLAEYFLAAEAKAALREEKRTIFGSKKKNKKKTEDPAVEKAAPKAGRILMKRPKFLDS